MGNELYNIGTSCRRVVIESGQLGADLEMRDVGRRFVPLLRRAPVWRPPCDVEIVQPRRVMVVLVSD